MGTLVFLRGHPLRKLVPLDPTRHSCLIGSLQSPNRTVSECIVSAFKVSTNPLRYPGRKSTTESLHSTKLVYRRSNDGVVFPDNLPERHRVLA